MLRLSKATHDQLAILLFVNRSTTSFVSVRTIASGLNLSSPTALKHVSRLVQAQLLRAKRGPGGGVVLARPASSIVLGESIKLLEDLNTSESRKLEEMRTDQRSFDFLHAALIHFVEFLNKFTLADLEACRYPRSGLTARLPARRIGRDGICHPA
jgi:DNA-binding IscR family transcriptional regulator